MRRKGDTGGGGITLKNRVVWASNQVGDAFSWAGVHYDGRIQFAWMAGDAGESLVDGV